MRIAAITWTVLTWMLTLPALAVEVNFSRDVRPILSTACLHCHGPDEHDRESDLRLDTRQGALGDRGGYAAFVPGQPGESEAFRRIISTDPDEQMPPPGSGKSLSAEQIDLIRRWVEQGATWREHWSFVKPERPAVPEVVDTKWVRNPIDNFVLARLEREGLRPSPDADPVTLLRRLHLDLIGLPPRIEEVARFLAAGGNHRYDQAVEQLLASSHYGERWGRVWLDAARYADSDGFEKDKPRNVWMYRDWVIAAHNRDLPFDRFIVEQVAGDLLPNPTQSQIVATGFLRNSMINEEGGIDPEQFRMEAMFDRMDAIGKAVLGLTVQCGQCHNHKYDPLTQSDYYRMFAILNNSHEANITVFQRTALQQRMSVLSQIADIEARLQKDEPAWKQLVANWARTVRPRQPQWKVLEIESYGNNSGQKYLRQPDGSLLAQGYAPTKYDATFQAETDVKEIRAIRLEVLTDPNLPAGGPGRSVDGLFALTEFQVDVASVAEPENKRRVEFRSAFADFANEDQRLDLRFADRDGKRGLTGKIDYALDGDEETAWGIDAGPGRRNRPRQAIFVADENLASPEGTRLTIHLVQKHGGWNSDDNQNLNLGRFRIALASQVPPTLDVLPADVQALVQRPCGHWNSDDWQTAFRYWRTIVPEWQADNAAIEELWRLHPTGTTQLVLSERPEMRPTFRLERGDFLKPLESVQPGVPEFLHPLQTSGPPNRLDFARWLVDRSSPTTARAIVNRVWQTYFGTGLVATSEDLGLQGEAPSHPKLLDWLAVEFMDMGWSLKDLHRLIVHSRTYQQSSQWTPELLERDPDNRLLARSPRFRVDGELVRDIALAASGLLDREVGGRSVYPPAPAFLFEPPASYGPKKWLYDTGPAKYRRGLYTFRFRSVPYPVLQVFDVPNGDTACVRRPRSNTPLQALTTLNEPLFFECAQELARRTLRDGGETDMERLAYAFRRCLARLPTPQEIEVLADLLNATRRGLEEVDERELVALAGTPAASSQPAMRDPATVRRAVWTTVCRVMLNLDETFTRE